MTIVLCPPCPWVGLGWGGWGQWVNGLQLLFGRFYMGLGRIRKKGRRDLGCHQQRGGAVNRASRLDVRVALQQKPADAKGRPRRPIALSHKGGGEERRWRGEEMERRGDGEER